jgi:hypothetical protein
MWRKRRYVDVLRIPQKGTKVMKKVRTGLSAGVATFALVCGGSAAYSNTRILNEGCSTAFVAQPAVIVLSCDDTSVLGGHRTSTYRFGEIHWTSYGSSNAYGRGVWWANNCQPDCANGHWSGVVDKLHAYRPRRGRFTRLTVTTNKGIRRLRLTRAASVGWVWA